MKRAFLKSAKIIPYEAGSVIDRYRFLSAIFAASVTAADAGVTMSLAITHCDTENGTFTAVTDPVIALSEKLTGHAVQAGQLLNLDIDLLECKRYVKITPTFKGGNAEADFALGLGDCDRQPV